MNQRYMTLAIKEAKKSTEDIGCGAIIIKENKIIGKGYNTQRETHNATAHAEINAIKAAGRKIKNKKLEECIIYCTCEPCIMCLSALSYAKVKKIIYGMSMNETYSKDRIIDINIEQFLNRSPHKIEIEKGFMKEECQKELFTKKTAL